MSLKMALEAAERSLEQERQLRKLVEQRLLVKDRPELQESREQGHTEHRTSLNELEAEQRSEVLTSQLLAALRTCETELPADVR